MKEIMITVKPADLVGIMSGIVGSVLYRSRPKFEPPYRCYVYCAGGRGKELVSETKVVVGEFICDKVEKSEEGDFYYWHITNFKKYETPKKPYEFTSPSKIGNCIAPTNWAYVEAKR